MRRLAAMLVVLALLEGVFYLLLVSGQGDGWSWATAWVAALIVVPALASAVGAVSAPPFARGLLLGFGVLGATGISLLSMFSIGLAMLPLAGGALVLLLGRLGPLHSGPEWGAALLGGVLGLVAVVGYVREMPFLPPACPSGVTATGNSHYPAGFLYGDQPVNVNWTCDKGKLVSWSH